LLAPSGVLLERKPHELSKSLIDKKTELYHFIARQNRIEIVDTDVDFSTVHEKILELCLKAFYEGKTRGLIFNYDNLLRPYPASVSFA
jgi:hypothetical protein